MQRIEGVDLKALADEVADKLRAEQIEVTKAALRHMHKEVDTHAENARKLTEQLAAAQKKLETAKVRYQKAVEGDWSVISDKTDDK